ncbi:protein-tyrosine phosphatase family protein [Corallincola spongiicola]|uniref:Tyrosine specific protein phosphatases domain-containing protein n=1 Tax=Corallincola spongiicola TaxID=2520508 RepID=A0ABY1WN72_9GAMM|nr:tyrosine-protein phosphatase [Corallincola spongiicola]TAA45008.1 hypothetical protein EXY25_12415 [Corallincola spongiicola]
MAIDELISRIEAQLTTGPYDPAVNKALIADAKVMMADDLAAKKRLGPLIGRLKTAPPPSNDVDLNWLELSHGGIAIGHRPKMKLLKNMQASGVTHIMTLLSEKEGAKEIGRAAEQQGLTWLWLPLPSAEPPAQDRVEAINELFSHCVDALQAQAKIYIHCSAGIHRTGMIAYALLRYMGFNSSKSESLLADLRGVTANEVGDHRKRWGDQFSGQ